MSDTQYKKNLPDETPTDWRGYDARISPTDKHPVQRVSWCDAVMFCNWLSRKEDRDPSYERTGRKEKVGSREYDEWKVVEGADGYRLPTEDQWEYACRASTTTDFAIGDDTTHLPAYAVYAAARAERCGTKMCNAWGLFDMHGNVYEWCGNTEDNLGSSQVNRGGGWNAVARYCQSSRPSRDVPSSPLYYLGFRVALVPLAEPSKQESGAESGGR
jgi:formylglycine-generating enzyme required for sulfatase activity